MPQHSVPLWQGGGSTGLVGRLLFSHLVLHGHWGAAAAVSRDLLGGSAAVPPVDVADFALRAHVRASIAAGDMDGALQHAEAYLPGGLASASPALLFRLQCQKLVELVRPPPPPSPRLPCMAAAASILTQCHSLGLMCLAPWQGVLVQALCMAKVLSIVLRDKHYRTLMALWLAAEGRLQWDDSQLTHMHANAG